MAILINLFGLTLILFTFWFFFKKKMGKAVLVEDEIVINVEGGYKPEVIKVKKGKTVTLKFHRLDKSSCLEEVVIPDFNIKEFLPRHKYIDVVITPSEVGEHEISCGMNMFHGKIIVEE